MCGSGGRGPGWVRGERAAVLPRARPHLRPCLVCWVLAAQGRGWRRSLVSCFSAECPALGGAGLCAEIWGRGGGTLPSAYGQWWSWGSPRPHGIHVVPLVFTTAYCLDVWGSWWACDPGVPGLGGHTVSPRGSPGAHWGLATCHRNRAGSGWERPALSHKPEGWRDSQGPSDSIRGALCQLR